jgi:subtilase family serine protease
MKLKTPFVAASAALLASGTMFAALGGQPAGASSSSRSVGARHVLAGSAAPASERKNPVGAVTKSTMIKFDLVLQERNPSAAAALVRAISTPGSAEFRHYITAAQWEARFAPTQAQVNTALEWLKGQGFRVGTASKDHITVSASGTAGQVEKAFGTNLENYRVAGHVLRLATSNLSIPASLSPGVIGAMGINEVLETPAIAPRGMSAAAPRSVRPRQYPAPPAGFVVDTPCSAYYAKSTTALGGTGEPPAFGGGYSNTQPDAVCGYTPAQMRGAYGVTAADTGAGATVAIIDAYGSGTIASDATTYFKNEDASNPFSNANFSQIINPAGFDQEAACGASGWSTEQALDVEAVHSMAPKATVLYVSAQDCFDTSFVTALQTVIDNGLANVVTNSWGDTAGDLFEDAAGKAAYDTIFQLAASTGISVLFASGDYADNYAVTGISAPDYPPSSPYVTAVGGTSLYISSTNTRAGEYGWLTGESKYCASNLYSGSTSSIAGCTSADEGKWSPTGFVYGSGGFTSYNYTQPWYQAPVVPSALSLRNEAIFGPVPLRVVPDISLNADPQTGFLIGLTQDFTGPAATDSGLSGDQFATSREGGTSEASPLLAGLVADADQVGGVAVGFLNPAIYKLKLAKSASIYDVPAEATPLAQVRYDYANLEGDTAAAKTLSLLTLREQYFKGPEVYCDATGNCESRPTTQVAGPGYDSLTGLGSPGPGYIAAVANF